MPLEDSLKTTVIKSQTLTEKPEKQEVNLKIRKATKKDFKHFKSSKEYSKQDVQLLREADVCVVVKDNNTIVHHGCAAIESFRHLRGPLKIALRKREAYIYNVWTRKSYRGRGIFRVAHSWLAQYLYRRGVRKLYSEVDALNEPSLKAFQKVGYRKSGERHDIDAGKFTVHVITGESIYAEATEVATLIGDIEIARTHNDRFVRIKQELEEYIEEWKENNSKIVLFGAGNHAQKIINKTEIESLVEYAVDEDLSKIGSRIPNSNISVQPVEELAKREPEAIIICSEAFQNDMAIRAEENSKAADIIVLYPHVSPFSEKD